MKKLFIILSLVLMAGVFLSACGEAAPPAPPEPPGPAAQDPVSEAEPAGREIELVFLSRASIAEAPHIFQAVDDFNAANEGRIRVIGDHIADEQANLDRLRTGFATGNPPNIFHGYGGSREVEYARHGLLFDWDEEIATDTEWSGRFLNLWDKWQYPDFPGTFGVPYEMVASTLFINSAIFEELGLDAPVTIEDFERVCAILLENGYIPMALGARDVWRTGHLFNFLVLKSMGVEGRDRLADRSLSYDSPEVRRLVQMIYDWNQRGYFGPNAVSVDYNQEQALFFEGRAAMRFDGSWNIGVKSNSPVADVTVPVPFPYIDERFKTSRFGNAVGLSVTMHEDPDVVAASVEFVKFMSSEDFFVLNYTLRGGQLLPAIVDEARIRDVPVSPIFSQFYSIINLGTEFSDDIQTYDPIPALLDIVRGSLQGLFVGQNVDDFVDAVMEEIRVRS